MSNNNENNNWWNTTGGQNVQSGFWSGIGMLGGHQQERRNYRNNRNLMGLQNKYQKGLNQQGHDLQMDMWNKTNYGAQVGHMKDAGLNPALMYGSAGQGGTTGSQGGGSASMGSSSQGKVMDLSNALIGAQIEGLKAKATKDLSDAGVNPSKTGLNEKLGSESEVRAELGRENIKLTQEQVKQVSANVKKLLADSKLTDKIREMDYGGNFGKNYTQNIIDIVSGELDLSTYVGLATGIAGLTTLRSAGMLTKIGRKGLAGVKGAITKFKSKLKGGKKSAEDVTRATIDRMNNVKNLKN